jgi:two-component system, NarL family, sensor histidine kinase UhpB
MGKIPVFSSAGLPRYAEAMDSELPAAANRKNSVRRDLAIVVGVSLAAAILCVRFDVSEALAHWTRPLESLQIDEMPGILLVVALCLVWFSARRYFEAKLELSLRRQAEARLAESLAENQKLALKYVDMQEHERKTLAHDLHDELGQYVNAIKLDAVSMREAACGNAAMRDGARAMIVNVDRVYDVLRGLIRQLRPVGLDDLGLAAALEHCANEWRSRLPSAQIDMLCRVDLEALDEPRSMVIFRLVQEALTNVVRHSGATRVRIHIAGSPSSRGIEVAIDDNGRGTDLSLPRAGLGLVGMRERVAALGGSIALASNPGAGFRIDAFLPRAESHDR